MKKEDQKVYAARITQASKSELVVITYEIILKYINGAKEAHSNNDLLTFDNELKHANKFVTELMDSLDYKQPISLELIELYLHTNKSIITALLKRNPKELDIAESILTTLLTGFQGVSAVDKSGPVMQNTQQVYAGLTYGRGTLNESLADVDYASRGFKA